MRSIIKFLLYVQIICLFLSPVNLIRGQLKNFIIKDTIYFEGGKGIVINSPFMIDSILSVSDLKISRKIYNFRFISEEQKIELLDSVYEKNLIVVYKVFPIKKETFQKNIPQIKKDTISQKNITTFKSLQSKNFADEIFGSRIESSGSISRGFSLGTNKDFTINSSLRLQLNGQLSNDIEIVAVLSDQNSPIQPEGNTRTLQEIDRVYIDLKHKFAQATFGDYQYTYKIGTFGVVDKKLQGLKTTALLDEKNFLNIAYASSRGKFKTQQFNGIDGVQGPYRLTGENNERDIIVLAGTEKVYINGEEKIRGENYDYTIDYSTGEIFFTPKVVITNLSRIKVDFEYSDRKFDRNFFGTILNSSLFEHRFAIGFSYFREGDNQDLPIDISLSREDIDILSSSGSDRLKASKSGIKYVGYDSTGKPAGSYRLRDTLINGQSFQFYRFDPGGDSAFYNVSFSYVGENKGDYIRLGLGRFEYVGPNAGNYLPIVLLPMPELKQVSNLFSKFFITKNIFLEGDISISSFDRNRFSSLDNNQNKGIAYSYRIGIDSIKVDIFNLIDGTIAANYFQQKTEATYSTINRFREIEFERNWNIFDNSESIDELLQEFQFQFNRKDLLTRIQYGKLKRGSNFNSDRFITILNSEFFPGIKINYTLTNLISTAINYKSYYNKHSLGINYSDKYFNPYIKFEFENKIDRDWTDSLQPFSFKFYDLRTGVATEFFEYLKIDPMFNLRQDFFPINNNLYLESKNYIYQLSLKLKNIRDINSSLDFSFRQKKYSEVFKKSGNLDNQSIAIKYFGRGFFFNRFLSIDLFYEVSSQRSAKLERIFLRVPKGTGQYIYKGDLNNNGISDDFEFEPTKFEGDYILTVYPTDELFPVTNLKASLRVKLDFKNFSFSRSIKFLEPISTETYLRVEENSQDKKESNVYLLKLSSFQNPLTTLRGSNLIQQDLNFFEYNPDFNVLFRFIERRGFSKYNLTDERKFQQEKLIRLRIKPLSDFANQTEISFIRYDLFSSNFSVRNFLIRQVFFNSKVFYYPYKNVEASLKIEVGKSRDLLPIIPTEINSNTQEFTLTIMYSQQGNILTSIERTEMIVNQKLESLPFELTRGYSIGRNYIWRVSVDYQFANNIQTSIMYNGRVQGVNPPIHNATAEVRAYF